MYLACVQPWYNLSFHYEDTQSETFLHSSKNDLGWAGALSHVLLLCPKVVDNQQAWRGKVELDAESRKLNV